MSLGETNKEEQGEGRQKVEVKLALAKQSMKMKLLSMGGLASNVPCAKMMLELELQWAIHQEDEAPEAAPATVTGSCMAGGKCVYAANATTQVLTREVYLKENKINL
jgi:hypothetical protein